MISDVWGRPAAICVGLCVLTATIECQHLYNEKTAFESSTQARELWYLWASTASLTVEHIHIQNNLRCWFTLSWLGTTEAHLFMYRFQQQQQQSIFHLITNWTWQSSRVESQAHVAAAVKREINGLITLLQNRRLTRMPAGSLLTVASRPALSAHVGELFRMMQIVH